MVSRREVLAGMAASTALPMLPAAVRAAETAAPAAVPVLPKGFLFGASTSSYQIEGGVHEGGRGPSIWDTFSHTPGRIADGSTGDVACDHYGRYVEDVDLIADGGFGAYRFSIAWPRVQPTGAGPENSRGLDFYDRLVDRLLARGVEPWACLYHWDLPQPLQDQGGWTNRDIAGRFSDYALLATARLGDRVRHWAMLNEPNVHAIFGHGYGNHAPGLTGWANLIAAQHHQNLAQGTALAALRASRPGLVLGTVLSLQPVLPATDRDEDREAAIRFDAVWNGASLDPLFRGLYPDVLAADYAPLTRTADMQRIQQPIDFLGVNYYGRGHVVNDPNGIIGKANFGPLPPGTPVTAMGWPVEPIGLVEVMTRLREDYGNPPTYITENGACYDDPAPAGGTVADPQRTEYIRLHLDACAKAIADGTDLKGYLVWSLLDNFEWSEGFRRRFGVVHVDFTTLVRTPKSSYRFLGEVIAASR